MNVAMGRYRIVSKKEQKVQMKRLSEVRLKQREPISRVCWEQTRRELRVGL